MGGGSRLRERREKLARHQRGKCFFCRVLMTPVNTGPTGVTLFHLDDRYSAERGRHNGEYRTVASCQKCTNERAEERTLNMPLDELHRRSHRPSTAEEVGYYVAGTAP